MKALEELTWKRPSEKHIKRVILFLIRCVEIATASVIPSFLGIVLVFLKPGRAIMLFMNFVSFLVFACFNCWFTIRFVRRRAGRGEFYVINGFAYAVFVLLSVITFKFGGDLGYTVIFSNMRLFEAFGASTVASLVTTHIIILITMIVCEILARIYYRAYYQKIAQEQTQKVEMKFWDDTEPTQKDKAVRFLTIDEAFAEMENDRIESAQVIEESKKVELRDIWNEGMVKGSGESVELAKDDDELFDETVDYESFKDFEVESTADVTAASVYDDYDADSLWNKDIYKGRTRGEMPIYDYDDEPEEMYEVMQASDDADDDENEPIWDSSLYRGRERDESSDIVYEPKLEPEYETFEYENNCLDDYDTDNLWGNIVQGRNNDE